MQELFHHREACAGISADKMPKAFSANACHYGRITKAGNPQARWFLTQAAQQVAQHPGQLGVFFRRLKAKRTTSSP
jgi:hypothetical protein